jgi:hypothetical protein
MAVPSSRWQRHLRPLLRLVADLGRKLAPGGEVEKA